MKGRGWDVVLAKCPQRGITHVQPGSPNWVKTALKKCHIKGAWVAQSVKCLTLDFGSGHDLMVVRSSPA